MTFDRLRRVAAAAVEQCHRSRLPEITGPHAWSQAVGLAGAEVRLVPGHRGDRRRGFQGGTGLIPRAGASRRPPGRPGGGLDRRTEGAARRRLAPGGLGGRTLRLETAAVVGAAFLLLGAQDPADDPSPDI